MDIPVSHKECLEKYIMFVANNAILKYRGGKVEELIKQILDGQIRMEKLQNSMSKEQKSMAKDIKTIREYQQFPVHPSAIQHPSRTN